MVRIGLHKGNSFEITAVPCVFCQVSESKGTLLFLPEEPEDVRNYGC